MRSSLAIGALVLALAAGCSSTDEREYSDVNGPKDSPPAQQPKRKPEPRPAPAPAPAGSYDPAPAPQPYPTGGGGYPTGGGTAPSRETAAEPASPPAKQKPAPRVLVLTFARADQPDLAAVVQSDAEQVLQDLRFPMVDESQVMARYQLADLERFLILTPETVRMAELKARFGAELIAVVQYTRRFQYEREIVGTRNRFYKNDVRVKVIAPDTAEVIYSGGGEGSIEARQTGLEELTKEHMKKAAERILERWSYEAVTPSTYQVVALGMGASGARSLGAALRQQRGVHEVIERQVAAQGGEALIEVKFLGSIDELKAALEAVSDPAVAVEGASANRIDVRQRNP